MYHWWFVIKTFMYLSWIDCVCIGSWRKICCQHCFCSGNGLNKCGIPMFVTMWFATGAVTVLGDLSYPFFFLKKGRYTSPLFINFLIKIFYLIKCVLKPLHYLSSDVMVITFNANFCKMERVKECHHFTRMLPW